WPESRRLCRDDDGGGFSKQQKIEEISEENFVTRIPFEKQIRRIERNAWPRRPRFNDPSRWKCRRFRIPCWISAWMRHENPTWSADYSPISSASPCVANR